MKKTVALLAFIALFGVSCHRVYIEGGTAYPTRSGYVSVGGAVRADDSAAAVIAASLIGILVGSAIYSDVHSYKEEGLGAYDINIRPKDADIFLDGVYVGQADDFDGSPKFLVVKPGTHTIVAKKRGYKTYRVRVSVNPGEQININKKLEPEYFRERQEVYENEKPASPKVAKAFDNVRGTVKINFQVNNENAKVYFDNHFVGTIAEIKQLHKPLIAETSVKSVTIEHDGVKVVYSLEKLIKEQGDTVTVKAEF